jgi:hypothetical protein
VSTIDRATAVIGAAWGPLQLDFVHYRTPFALLTPAEIEAEASVDRNPFHEYFEELCARIASLHAHVVGISVAFPGQLQPAWSLARMLKQRLPSIHVTAGGPAITQVLARLAPEAALRALCALDSAVLFEGEHALLALVRAVAQGKDPCADGRIIKGLRVDDLNDLPLPDFDGLPLKRYFAPEPVLPYDPTRGCYWGKCGFCHYGLAEVGTASYRERDVQRVVAHLAELARKHDCRMFYLSQDTFAPATAGKLGRAISRTGLPIRWATDMRPERGLSPEICQDMAQGGALAVSLGIESGSTRVLKLINKGVGIDDLRRAVENLASAGIAVEAMAFSGFPTESAREALATLRMIEQLGGSIALFMFGEFTLTHGATVARDPQRYGIEALWEVTGDELATSLFWRERKVSKSERDHATVEAVLDQVSSGWVLRHYPWAGALSTAHSMLVYAKHGPGAFRGVRPVPEHACVEARCARSRFDVAQVSDVSAQNEAAIWNTMITERRQVSRQLWRTLARRLSAIAPKPSSWRYGEGVEPTRVLRDRTSQTQSGGRSK